MNVSSFEMPDSKRHQKAFRDAFQAIVDQNPMNRPEIARRAGVDPRTIGRIYNGEVTPTPWVLKPVLEQGLELPEEECKRLETLRIAAEEERNQASKQNRREQIRRYRETEPMLQSVKSTAVEA